MTNSFASVSMVFIKGWDSANLEALKNIEAPRCKQRGMYSLCMFIL